MTAKTIGGNIMVWYGLVG